MTARGRGIASEDSPDRDGGEMLSVAAAARIAECSVRTIRRAYCNGNLIAWRDGNGRGVRIRYRDLRRWMMATSAGPARSGGTAQAVRALEYLDMRGKVAPPSDDYLALLDAARAQQHGSARARPPARR